MSTNKDYKWIGTRPIRPDGADKVTGRAAFGADKNLPGMLHAKILRSPFAHAKILSIDTSAAESASGVLAVMTSADMPDLASEMGEAGESAVDFRDLSHNILASGKVLYHGHAVAAVAATSAKLALAALKLIKVEYEELPVVLEIEDAMADDAPILHEDQFTPGGSKDKPSNVAAKMKLPRGDIDKGFAEADIIIEREFTTPTVHQGYIEPHAVTASMSASGHADIWCCTQGTFVVRAMTAKVLGMDVGKIKVTPSEIGGGFGAKTTVYLEPIAVKLSEKTGRPVKMVMDREEVLRATGPTSASVIKIKLGATNDGKLIAAQGSLKYGAGAFKGSPMAPGCMCVFASYEIPNFLIRGFDVVLNKPKVAAYRAPGAPMAAFAMESLMNEMATKLNLDPIEFRLKNAVKEGSVAAYGPKFPVIGFVETLEAAKAHPHYSAPLGKNQGRGVGTGFWFNIGMQSSATINVNESGSVTVITGSADIGGSRASMALFVAEELDISYDLITPLVSNTEEAGYCDVTGGSRTTFATGMAVVKASKNLVANMRKRAAKTWGIDIDDVTWEDGAAIAPAAADKQPLTMAQIATSAAKTGGPLTASASLTAQGAGAGFGVHICDVEVDPETGKTDVIRYTAIQDAGKAIHPSYVEGQYQGGAVQGIGWALNEEYVYNDKGVLQNFGFLDYRMPVANDLPMIDTVIVEVPNPSHPYGVRGVGETPIVPPLAAVAEAVNNAAGVRICHLPISPPRLLAEIDAK
ncbi:MAG: xanthine dehydrogenase family protein molybdopterin-binding subunit [Pseudomonadales bacterium]|nr:xanthine dehydrogenase family protein molybdopterin-binding subunit [Pseudomonadales bacterium]